MKIGLIQSESIGDILIALPIAYWYIRQGHEVLWPINQAYSGFFGSAAPEIEFIGLAKRDLTTNDYYFAQPYARLQAAGCSRIISLYNYLPDSDVPNASLAHALKFDEYKYAVAGVPFSEKWRLGEHLKRDRVRELALHDRLGIKRDYICVHATGSSVTALNPILSTLAGSFQIIEITELTDNPFDWIYTIEKATRRLMLDSSLANLTDQLNITGDNYLILRSSMPYTPVFRNGWTFITPTMTQATT